ncbi:MAG: FAD:protein FMN transferase [Bacteroidales bacterium]|nr:FAD:protein FMN transferase [Bacteroidales bacterium]
MEFIYSSRNPEARTAFASFRAMHTVFEMLAVDVPEEKARRLAEEVEGIVLSHQRRLDRHDPESVFHLINASGGKAMVPVDEDTFSILQFCEVFRKSTSGYFDISALSEYLVAPAYSLDADSMGIKLSGAHVMLDAGGFGKGYALDRVREFLVSEGVRSCLLNFGDSSVSCVGHHPFGDSWQVSAENTGGVFMLNDSSLSISGCRPDGSAHIVDPGRGELVSEDYMIAVEGRSAFVCEVLSTALYAAPQEMRPGIASAFDGYRYSRLDVCFQGL